VFVGHRLALTCNNQLDSTCDIVGSITLSNGRLASLAGYVEGFRLQRMLLAAGGAFSWRCG
jgi:hypothetical protein